MPLTRTLATGALSIAAGSAAAFVAVGVSGDYMAWVFGAVWAGIAAPLAGIATPLWHGLGTRYIARRRAPSADAGHTTRGVASALTVVASISLVLGAASGFLVEPSVGPPVGLSLLCGGLVYVLLFQRWHDADALGDADA